MKTHAERFPIGKMAQMLRVSTCGYYEFLHRKPSKRALENQELIEEIKKIHASSRRTYGSPRVYSALKQQGKNCSRKRIARLMRQQKIQAKMRKKWKVTTHASKKEGMIALNYLEQNFKVEAPDKVWISDITYIPTQEGWLYVAIVMDLFSRKVVGLSMGNKLETTLVIKALRQALLARKIPQGLLHHSDRGCQYTSKEFKEVTNRHRIKLSMSSKGHCYDNAVAESFFHTLKTEETSLCTYRGREEAKVAVFEYIEAFYNRSRLHSTLGYLSPVDFEEAWEMSKKEKPTKTSQASSSIARGDDASGQKNYVLNV